jgi:hypothetical protein
MSQKTQKAQETQEPQQPQVTQETQTVSTPVVVPVVQAQPTKKKSRSFSKFFSLLVMLCLVVGFFIPVYLQANRQTGSGSILCGTQTLFAFTADALSSLFTGKTTLSAFLSSVSANRMIWLVIGCTVAVFLLTVITLFSKKHTRGWFFLTCVFAVAAGYPYVNKLGLVDVVKSLTKNVSIDAFPGADLILVGALLAGLFSFLMALFCFLRALFSSKKRAVFAVFCFLASAALLVYTYSDKTVGVTYGVKYFGRIAYRLAKGQQTTMVLSEALPYAATLMILLNVVIEAVRIGNGYKAGGFTVFRYLILAAVVVIGWGFPVFTTTPIAISFTPALVMAIAALVLFILAIIAAVQNGKKKAAAKAAAAKPQVIVTYVAAEAQAK